MELKQILSKMESEGWEIADDFKKAHGHFLQYFLETVEEQLRQSDVRKSVCVCKGTGYYKDIEGKQQICHRH